jgi:hypothetical protein
VTISKKADDCDIAVGETIAIKILYGLHDGSKETMHKRLRSLFDEYDHLLLYGHQLSPEHTDIWRHLKRSLESHTTDTKQLWTHATLTDTKYRMPMTETTDTRTAARKFGVHPLLLGFAIAGAQALINLGGETVMGSAFIGMIVVFNAVVVTLGVIIARA